jgi:hypothetical protein
VFFVMCPSVMISLNQLENKIFILKLQFYSFLTPLFPLSFPGKEEEFFLKGAAAPFRLSLLALDKESC